MKNGYKFDFLTGVMTVSQEFKDGLDTLASEQMEIYDKYHERFPNLRVVVSTHKRPSSYTLVDGSKSRSNPYKGLTYDKMERFLTALPDGEYYSKDYLTKKTLSNNSFAQTRKWFLETFPMYPVDVLYYFNTESEVIPMKKITG